MSNSTIPELLEEPQWAPLQKRDELTRYSRPLIGTESFLQQYHEVGDGMGEVAHGIIFDTVLSQTEVLKRLYQSLGYLRFIAPLVAATIEVGIHDPQLGSWVYTPASSAEQVERWAIDTLEVIDCPFSTNDFISHCNSIRTPHTLSDQSRQYIKFYLLKNLTEEHAGKTALFVHGTHAILDATPTLNIFHILLDEIANPKEEHALTRLTWGEEYRNLPPGPVTATGGPRLDWQTKGAQLLGMAQAAMSSDVPTHSLRSQRTSVEIPGSTIRVTQSLDPNLSSRILKGLKLKGYTATQLWEAAWVLARFVQEPDLKVAEDEAHVTMDSALMGHFKHLVPPYNRLSHVVSSMTIVPIKIPYAVIKNHADVPIQQLCDVMDHLKAAYAAYASNPHWPHLTAWMSTYMPMRTAPSETLGNQNAGVFTNVGLIDRMLPLAYKVDGENEAVIEIDDMVVGHRMGHSLRELSHCWTFKGRIYMQSQTSDAWDEGYLQSSVRKTLDIVSLIAVADSTLFILEGGTARDSVNAIPI